MSSADYEDQNKRFNDIASRLLIERGLVVPFLEHIGLPIKASTDREHLCRCPVCDLDTCTIWFGKLNPIGWKCSSGCHEGYRKKLLTLTRLTTGIAFGKTFKFIANYLGYTNPFDITNLGKPPDGDQAEESIEF